MKTVITFLFAANLASLLWSPQSADQDVSEMTKAEARALDVGRAYLDGMSEGELDALDELFVAGDRSSIYENGSNEGTWLHYKEHHLAPEQEAASNFRFTLREENAEATGDGFLVKVVGSFSVRVGEEARTYRAAVSYVLVPVEDELRILHLHWSSRQMK